VYTRETFLDASTEEKTSIYSESEQPDMEYAWWGCAAYVHAIEIPGFVMHNSKSILPKH
jgi:hypothetical protein